MPRNVSELSRLVRLSLPLVAGHAGNQLMSVVDTAMVGRVSAAALGGVGVGNAVYFFLACFGLGCVLGIDAPVSQAIGAGEEARARRVFWHGVRVGVYVGIPLTILVALGPLLLGPVGVDAGTVGETSRYLLGRLPNMIPFLVMVAQRSYLQARGVTLPIVMATIVANVVNVVANTFLIFGDEALVWMGLPAIGLPALGVLGAGIATTLASLASMTILGLAIARVPAPADPQRRRQDRALLGTILRLGVPFALQTIAEVGVFALTSVLAARMSATAVAAHQLAITLASFTFTVTLGIGAAAAVRVGHHIGKGDTPGARRAGFTAIGLSAAFMAVPAVAFLLFPHGFARLLSNDPSILAAAVPLVMIAAVFQLSDGIQATATGALRGAGDARVPLAANVLGHWMLGLPVAMILGLALGMGAPGLWWGLSAGLTVVAVTLVLRFHVISARDIARV
jgi:multidrug resistance protein, MATE family